MADIDRLMMFVETALPLGKDEWERLAASYNTNKPRGSPERDFRSLRRKFKVLYSTRKPTGMPNVPPHIKKAKEIKQTIDAKANVTEMDDEADDDQRGVEPAFCFDVDPDDSSYGDEEGVQIMTGATAGRFGTEASPGTDESVACESTVSSRSSSRGEFQDLLATPLVNKGFEDCARTSRPAPPSASTTHRVGSDGLSKPRKAAGNTVAGNAPLPIQQPLTQDLAAGRHDAVEADKYPKLHNYSNRLGGQNLTTFRDTVGAKRAYEEDKEMQAASFVKTKRMRAMKTSTTLKTKLAGLEASASNMGRSSLETILLREENELKAEERRAEGERRRRDDAVAQDARLRAEKGEAEERRRQEKVEMEDRACRDRDEARARTQVMLIGAITKNA